jgi:hypothetical protein
MSAPKRSAPGREIAGATAKLRVAQLYAACLRTATIIEQMPPAQILREIRSLRVTQAPVGRIFWGLEQAIARLTDELETRAS